MKLSNDNIDAILGALERQIHLLGREHVGVVVCGGTALAVLDLVPRTTKDVDVLAWAVAGDEGVLLQKITDFPDWLEESVRTVARDFGLPTDWFNSGPASQLDLGLPRGFETRLTRKVYGTYLTVYYIGRFDQIHFKLFAAIDRNDYHTQDLPALGPTGEEMLVAASWVLTQDVSAPFRMLLKQYLTGHGFENVAKRI